MRKHLLWGAVVLFIGAQFVQPSWEDARHAPTSDLIAATGADTSVTRLLRVACYDCHSDHVERPWYASVTPVNFWVKHHLDEGRAEFNMSAWGERSAKWQRHKASEAKHELEEGEMPLPSYTWMHGEARLSDAERERLKTFFAGLMGTSAPAERH